MAADDGIEKVLACSVCEGRSFRALPAPERWIGQEVFQRVKGQIGLARCRGCAFTFVHPRPVRALLDAFYASDDYGCHRANDSAQTVLKADFLLDRVGALQPGGGRLLDYGCGGGLLLRRARQRGVDAVGFDVGKHAVRTCREQGLPVAERLEDLPRASFDRVVLHHVFEHVSDPAPVLSHLGALLSARGRLFIEVPNAASLRARLSHRLLSRHLKFDERFRAYPIHLSYFDARTLPRLLERNGFRVEHVDTYGLGLDELIIDETAGREAYAEALPRVKNLRPLFSRSAREVVKRAVFEARLGENLLVVASV